MTFQQLDKIADACNPILMLLLIVLAFGALKNRAWPFLLRSGLAVVVVQQLSKTVQKTEIWGDDFPSTHFAIALALCISLIVLRRRFWPLALVYLVGYGALMLTINYLYPNQYHTPPEMLGAFFAVPIALLFHNKRGKTRSLTN